MKRILIVVNTYYQLIMAVQIKLTIKKLNSVDIIISDQSNNAKSITENLEKLNTFENVYYVENKEFCKKNVSHKKVLSDTLAAITGMASILNTIDCSVKYDELIFYNPDIFTHILFAALYRKNPEIKVSRFEEGILSYDNKFELYKKLQIIYKYRRVCGKKNLQEAVNCFYCVHPDIFTRSENVEKIPNINIEDADFVNNLSAVFNVDASKLSYPQKIIYFTSVFDFEGEEAAGELELIEKISEWVGKKNILIKVHPRDDSKRFTDAGLTVDINSSLPWEVIQLNYDFSDHIFLTTVSGSVLAINAIVENPPETYFLYPMFKEKHNEILTSAVLNFEKYYPWLKKCGLDSIKKIATKEELMRLLRRKI